MKYSSYFNIRATELLVEDIADFFVGVYKKSFQPNDAIGDLIFFMCMVSLLPLVSFVDFVNTDLMGDPISIKRKIMDFYSGKTSDVYFVIHVSVHVAGERKRARVA